MRVALALITLLTGLLAAASDHATAEHAVQYRYTVLGYLNDSGGHPLVGRRVQLIRDKTGLAYGTETDETGLYVIVARLGDETLGERLTLGVGDARTSVVVRFEADNDRDERGTRVDLEGLRWLEQPALFRSTLARILASPVR
jgi:hypothetical protein